MIEQLFPRRSARLRQQRLEDEAWMSETAAFLAKMRHRDEGTRRVRLGNPDGRHPSPGRKAV